MDIILPHNLEKNVVFEHVAEALKKENFTVIKQSEIRCD